MSQFEIFLKDYHKDDPNMPFPVDAWIDQERREVFGLRDDGPAVYVNWFQAAAYCNWLSRKQGLQPVYPIEVEKQAFVPSFAGAERPDGPELSPNRLLRNGYRLPTEVEWEFACRAGTTTPWYFGFNRDRLERYAHFRSASGVAPLRVATLNPNHLGLFDMLGNAMEWCHGAATYPEQPGSQAFQDELGDTDQVAVRGGSCQNLPQFVRSAYRMRQSPFVSAIDLGFRISRTIGNGESTEIQP